MKLAFALIVAFVVVAVVAFFVVGIDSSRGGAIERRGLPASASSSGAISPVDSSEREFAREASLPELTRLAATPGGDDEHGLVQHATQLPVVAMRARAVTVDGMPIPDATLSLSQWPGESVRADAQGRLELAMAADAYERLYETDRYLLLQFEVRAGGYGTQRVPRPIEEKASRIELGDVVLAPGATIHGRVVDASGLGVEGALLAFGQPVEVEPDDDTHAFDGPGDLRTTWRVAASTLTGASGPGGAFRFEGLPPGHGTLWARTETSLWTFTKPIGLRPGEEVGEIVLVVHDASERVIAGVLVDPEGRPVPRGTLSVRTADSPKTRSIHTDAAARFRYVARELVPHTFRANSPSWEWDAALVENVEPGTLDLVIAYQPSTWLWIEVRDVAGRAIPVGNVHGLAADGRNIHRCESTLGPDGRGRLRRVDQPLFVRVVAPGYRNALLGPFDPMHFPDPLVVELEHAPALHGKVRRANGAVAGGARVTLHAGAAHDAEKPFLTHSGWMGDGEPFVYGFQPRAATEVIADASGRYRLTLPGVDVRAENERELVESALPIEVRTRLGQLSADAPPPPRWFVRAAFDGEGSVAHGPLNIEGSDDVELDFELPATGSITGKLVVDAPFGWTIFATDGISEPLEAVVDDQAAFRFEHLRPGGWQVRAFEPGSRFYAYAGALTDVEPVADVTVVAGRDVELELTARRHAQLHLRGDVSLDGAAPGAWKVEALVRPRRGGVELQQTFLDPDGHFELLLHADAKVELILTGRVGDEHTWDVVSELDTALGIEAWSLELRTATLEGFLPLHPQGIRSLLHYEAEPAGVKVRVRFPAPADDAFGPFRVPAGHARLRDSGERYYEPGAVLVELDLAPGERRVVDLR